MARIPILNSPAQLNTGNQTVRTPNLPAVTNASIGKAVGDVSNVMMDISEKAKRANDVTKLTEASLAMNQAQVDFATFQQENPDESKWLPKWQELQDSIKSRFDQEELTPDARLQLSDRFSSWGTRGTIMVQANAFKQTGARMEDAGKLARIQSIEMKDPTPYKQHLDTMEQAGFITPEAKALEYRAVDDAVKSSQLQSLRSQESELMRLGNQGDSQSWIKLKENYDQQKALGGLDEANYDLAQKQAEMGELQALVQSRIYGNNGVPVDLERAKTIIEKSDLTPQVKADLESEVSRARTRYANQDIIAFADRMAKGEAIDGNDFMSPYMGEAELAETRAKINEAVPVTPEQEARFYLDTMTAIDDFDPEKAKERDPAEVVKMAKAALGIRKSPPHLRNLLAETMQAKMSNSEGDGIVADGEKRARSMLLEIVKGKEAEFFEGTGAEKKIKPGKESEWMKFQQRVFGLESQVSDRIKDVKDTQKIDQIVSDVLGADYTSVKKSAYMPAPQSGFGPLRINDNEETNLSLFPSFNAFQQ